MTTIWIDTTSGTWGAVEDTNGRLVVVDLDEVTNEPFTGDELLEYLDGASDSAIADFGNKHGRKPITRLTLDHVVAALNSGAVDEHLDTLIDVARSRKDIAATRKALSLDSGDEFLITNISPKLLTGERVRLEMFDGQWLVCTFVSYPAGKYRQGQTVKLRHSHVGTIVHRQH